MNKRSYCNKQSADIYKKLVDDLSEFPVSFKYGDEIIKGFSESEFKLMSRTTHNDACKESHSIILDMNNNVLRVKIITAYYPSHGAYEWTVWFENNGSENSKVISELIAVDMQFHGANPVLKGILGDHANYYQPYTHNLTIEDKEFISRGGRPTHVYFPYFNLEHGDGGSLISIGWGGTWEAKFQYQGEENTAFTGMGVSGLCTYLKPGESIRTPLISIIPYTVRNEDYATNLWRSWYIECNMPKVNGNGDPLLPFSATCLAGDTGLPNSDGSISERYFTWKPSIDKMLSENVYPTYRWFDAGWYPDADGNTVESDWWGTVGVWELDKEKWIGDSFRESVDYGHKHGIKTLVWFEPERVTNVDGLVKNHGYKAEWAVSDGHRAIANNIGDPDCLEWTLSRIIRMLDENQVDMYREDNNLNHAGCWAMKDSMEGENRIGITENKCVCGHYALWDGIIEHQRISGRDTFVDSCASGGGRNDLESMRRGVPLLRSDADRTTTALRLSMTTSFNKWIPMCGASSTEQVGQLDPDGKRDKYIFRASYNPILNFSAQWVQDPNTDYDMLHFGLNEWNQVKNYTLKDFYTLTDWHSQEDKEGWTAYIYHDSETDSGILFAFRMEDAKDDSVTLNLKMLSRDVMYDIYNFDTQQTIQVSGSELMAGYKVTLPLPRSAALFKISAVQ